MPNYFRLFEPYIVMAIVLLAMWEPANAPGRKHKRKGRDPK